MGNPNRRALGSNSLSSAKVTANVPKQHPYQPAAPKVEPVASSSAAVTIPPPQPLAETEGKKSALRPDTAPFIPNVPKGRFNTFGVYVPEVPARSSNVAGAVNATFVPGLAASTNVAQDTNATYTTQHVQAVIRTMPPPPPRLQHPLPPRPPPVATMAPLATSTAVALITSNPLAVTTSRRPYVTVERKDKSLREIVITSAGVFRNAHKKTTRYFPDGQTFLTFHNEFDAPQYDFVDFFRNGMNKQQQKEFLKGNGVEIVVEMDPLMVMTEQEGKGKAALTEIMAQESAATVIDSIKLMGPDFPRMVQKLTVTLNFVQPADRSRQIGTPVGPQQDSPAFKFIEELVNELHNFEGSLKSVTINLGVPQTNEKPFTMLWVMYVLPFYDLGFVDWRLTYTQRGMSIPILINGFSANQLDRERNKIIDRRFPDRFAKQEEKGGRRKEWGLAVNGKPGNYRYRK